MRRSRALALNTTLILVFGVGLLCNRVVSAQSTWRHGSRAASLSQVKVSGNRHSRRSGHFEYVIPDGSIFVYDIDHAHRLVQTIRLPQMRGVRGVAASPKTHMLYISYGGDGGGNGNGSLLDVDLLTDRVVWTQSYSHGIDSMAITPNGRTIYMPDGEAAPDGKWYVLDAATGHESGAVIDTAAGTSDNGPHNTVVSLDGKHVYLGDRNLEHTGDNYLYVADTRTNRIVKRIGPFRGSVRPFTVDGRQRFVYTSVTGFLGFQVGDIRTGKVAYTVPVNGFSWNGQNVTDPSHGISLAPNEKELYLVDWSNSYVHVFDVSHVSRSAPTQVANIRLTRTMQHDESPCAYDCIADGWLQHSRDGRYVYVGDEGDVIRVATHRVVINLPALYNTRKHIEIDWKAGKPTATTSRIGLGHRR